MICYSGLTALLLFLLARAAPASLPTAFSVALRSLFSFQQAQNYPVFPLKSAPFCTLFAGKRLGITNKSAIFLLFSFSLTFALSSPPCPLFHFSFYFKLCGRSGRNCVLSPPVLSGYNGSPDTRFSRGTTRLTSLPDRERYLHPPQSLVVSLLLSLVSTLVFSRTGGVLPLPSILTHRFPRFPPRNFAPSSCSLCSLSSTLQRTQPSVRFVSLQDWQNRESFPQPMGHSSQDTSHLILHCPATNSLRRSLFGDSLSLYDL